MLHRAVALTAFCLVSCGSPPPPATTAPTATAAPPPAAPTATAEPAPVEDAGSTVVYSVHGTLFEIVFGQRRFLRLLSRRDLQRIGNRLARLRSAWVLPLIRLLLAIRPLVGLSWRGIHRPKLVLFGDALCQPDWNLAIEAMQSCDCVLQVGCSGQVFPAALLTLVAKEHEATVIAIDLEDTAADIWLRGPAGEILPDLLEAAFDEDLEND